MVAYQLLRADMIDGKQWAVLNDRFHADWLASKAKKEKSEVSFYEYAATA